MRYRTPCPNGKTFLETIELDIWLARNGCKGGPNGGFGLGAGPAPTAPARPRPPFPPVVRGPLLA